MYLNIVNDLYLDFGSLIYRHASRPFSHCWRQLFIFLPLKSLLLTVVFFSFFVIAIVLHAAVCQLA